MNKNGLSFLRAPGKLIQVGMTVGQSRYRAELDELRLAVIAQWPQMMRSRDYLLSELRDSLAKASQETDGVVCLYYKVRSQGKIALYLEFANTNSLDALVNPAIIERCREQIPLLCWLMRNQAGAETGWENLTQSTLISGTHSVDGFGLARLTSRSTFAPWGSVIVTPESLFPDILTDPTSAEKDHYLYLAASRVFDQIERGVPAEDVQVFWSHEVEASIRENTPIISASVATHTRGRVWITVCAAVIAGFLGSWFITNQVKSSAASRGSGSSNSSREMKFFLWDRPDLTATPAKMQGPVEAKPSPTKALEEPKVDRAEIQKAEDVAKKRSDALKALGLANAGSAAQDQEAARRADALKALTGGK